MVQLYLKPICLELDTVENIHKAFTLVLNSCPYEDAGAGMRNVHCNAPLIGDFSNIVQYYPNGDFKTIWILGRENQCIELDSLPKTFVESILMSLINQFKVEIAAKFHGDYYEDSYNYNEK